GPSPRQRNEKRKETHPSSQGSCAEKWKEHVPGPALGKLIGRCEAFYPAGPGPPRGNGEGLDCPSEGVKPCLDADLNLGDPDCASGLWGSRTRRRGQGRAGFVVLSAGGLRTGCPYPRPWVEVQGSLRGNRGRRERPCR